MSDVRPREDRLDVLLLDGGRQSLPFMKSLTKAGHRVVVVCGSRLSEGYFSRYCEKRLLWGDYFHDREGFARRMLDYVAERRPHVTLGVGDVSVGLISEHKAELTQHTRVTVPDLPIFVQAADKANTMAFCMDHGIPCPETYFPERQPIEDILARAKFPVMVKPRRGIGAVGLHKMETADDLRRLWPTLEGQGPQLIQEFIPLEGGTQFQAEAFLDAQSRMKVCMVIAKPRFFPVTGGTSTANVTIERPDIQETVRRLLEGLGWSGAADVDLILDPRDNTPKVLEINPRVTAGIKIGFAAGIDYADLHLRLAFGEEIPAIPSYKLGVYSRNLVMELLWYAFSPRKARRGAWPPFFRFIGRDVVYQNHSLDDPLPLLGFVFGMIKKYSAPRAWKAKLGKDVK